MKLASLLMALVFTTFAYAQEGELPPPPTDMGAPESVAPPAAEPAAAPAAHGKKSKKHKAKKEKKEKKGKKHKKHNKNKDA